MKRSFFAAGLFTVLASTYSFGQTQTLVAQVPFDFHLGKTLMPAGKYYVNESGDLLSVRSMSGKASVFVLTLPAARSAKSADPKLEFQCYGKDYFLDKIWNADSGEARALPKSKREKELLAARTTLRHTDEITLQTKNRVPNDAK